MAYQTIYRLQATNKAGQLFIVHISDTTSGLGTPTYHDLKPMALSREVSNSGDDRFGTIASTTWTMAFVPTQTYSLNTFRELGDKRFWVEIFAANLAINIFRGYLLTDLTKEALLPKSVNGEWCMSEGVVLTASDMLPSLKDEPLVMPDDSNPLHDTDRYFKVIEYIAWALRKTGLALAISIIDGIYYAVDPEVDGNWYNTTYLWAKTFEGEETKEGFVCVDCYTALEMILKGRVLFQEFGQWWVLSRDEMLGGAYDIFLYDHEGTFLSVDSNTYTKAIGGTQPLMLEGKDAVVFPERPHKYDLIEWPYEMPRETPDNIYFSRDSTTPIFTAAYVDPDDGITKEERRFNVEDWTIGRYAINSEIAVSASAISAFIRRIYYPTDYEVQRYLVLPFTTDSLPNVYLRSNPIPVGLRDRVTFSVDFRFTSTSVSDFQNIWYALLKGDDGNYYWYNPATPGLWQNTNIYSGPALNATFAYQYHYTDNNSKVRWTTLGYEMKELPVNGELYFFLMACYASGQEVHYQNMSFDYVPCVNGSFSKYTSQFYKVYQAGDLKANLEEVVGVSDSPKKLFKGALHWKSGPTTYPLTTGFFQHYPLNPIGFQNFGKYQAFAYFHQHFNPTCKIQGSIYGLQTFTNPSNIPGLIHQYEFDFTTNDEHTADRWFCLLSYKQDILSGHWSGVFAEVVNNTEGHPYDADHENGYRI